MKFRIETLGCKVNQYETQQIRQALLSSGYIEASDGEHANLTIVNTCTVTHRSDSDARKLLRKGISSDRIVATGCLATTRPQEIRAISDKIVIVSKGDIEKVIDTSLPKSISGLSGRTRTFVKIQDGCSNFCTFCIVPFARGCPSSRPGNEIVEEINSLFINGCNEIVLCGINLGLYENGFSTILKRILKETGIPRIRISSIEPWTVKKDLIEVFSEPRICAHLHLPLQSGSKRILTTMGRPYDPSYFSSLVNEILLVRPETAIGTDIIAGFPGENEDDFDEGFNFLKNLPIAYMHVFPYSKRPGTKAADFNGQVDEAEKKRRAMVLRGLSQGKRSEFIQRRVGDVCNVLVTASVNGICKGITSNYITAVFNGNTPAGDIVKVRLEKMQGRHLQMKGMLYG
jgi:threonylcarbamoyladenosine tRNA methylthiotransferase MtaB